MVTSKEAVRRQRRRDLDARRSKLRVRLGACLQRWVDLKDRLGFSLHSQLAQYLLHRCPTLPSPPKSPALRCHWRCSYGFDQC
uniref:Uncharacterized protein n=1 Tax=Denticeps clupeoides TaxID=299321 RepID=A0AAY4DYH4_9TELE